MKVALVHDYIKEYGGAERMLEELHNIWPDAPVYTLVYLPKFLGPHRERFRNWKIKASILHYLPFKAKIISFFRFLDFLIYKFTDLSKYDLVIVSSAGSYSGLNFFKKGKKTLHICYYHTPPRYLYGYSTANRWTTNAIRRFLLILGQIPMHFLRMLDFNNAQKPDFLLCNSKEVQKRIKKFYRRDAKVIYPPVEIPNSKFQIPNSKKKYFLAGGRLARAKRVDLAVLACTRLNLPLKVFGKQFARYGDELKKLAGSSIEFLGEVDDGEKWELMVNAKAFIFPSEDEDFGITPVEAMAVGTPVIAYKSGGVLETVIDSETGILFDKPTVESVIKAIKKFEKTKIKPEDCINQAKKFSKERFKREIKEFVRNRVI